MPLSDPPDGTANHLLRSLAKASSKRLLPILEFQTLARGQVINPLDRPVDYHYFIDRGLISLVKTMQDGRSVEIGVVGIEGVTNPFSLFGMNRTATETIVQIAGDAFRVKHAALKRAMAEDDALRETLERYALFAFSAVTQTAACNRLHYIEERCCRWLLICHDSAGSDTFRLTHEFLAMMLGVQRAGVTIAANFLQKAGLIRYLHGQVTITNRTGLEQAACECYAAMHKEYEKVIRKR